MRRPIWRLACAALAAVLAAALAAPGAHAQIGDLLHKGPRDLDLKGMAGMASSPLASGSMGNVAGLLQYCIGNNYLSGQEPASVKDQLMGKLPENKPSEDRAYGDGQKGLLHASNGKLMDLSSGGGLGADVTKKACDTILTQAKSFL